MIYRWHIIAVMTMLVALATGCRGTHTHDERLRQADSLINDFPDSALTLIEAVNPTSLSTREDLAYRDLLLTQARYKCYIVATSDSDINRALDYYRQHKGEREKCTRAYIYKGAVMEELGSPDSAMFYYKLAEATAAPDDYANLGYVNMRMGALYRDYYTMDGKHIEKYETAIEYLQHTNDSKQLIRCMINLGSLYRLKRPDKSESILLSAKKSAHELNDTNLYIKSINSLIQTYYMQKRYRAARELIHEALALQRSNLALDFYTNAADVYAKLGKPDSAALLLNLIGTPEFSNVIDEMSYIESQGEIALAKGDTTTYRLKEQQCKRKMDSLQSLDASMKIMKTEKSHDQNAIRKSNEQSHFTKICLIIVIIFLLLVLALLSFLYYRRSHRYDTLIADLRQQHHSHVIETKMLQERIRDLNIKDQGLVEYFDSHLWLMHDVIEECTHLPDGKTIEKIKNIIRFNEQNKDNWQRIMDYIDLRYNNILSNIRRSYPKLSDRDLMLLALSILDFSCSHIAIIMGYSNPSSVGTIRQRLAKKMGVDINIKQFIDQLMQQL